MYEKSILSNRKKLGKLLHMYGVPAESYGLRKKLKTLNSPLKNYNSAGTNYLNFFGFYVDK